METIIFRIYIIFPTYTPISKNSLPAHKKLDTWPHCTLCEASDDTQEHILECPVLGPAPAGVEYGHIRGDTDQQKRLVEDYVERLKWREEYLEEN